MPRKKIDWESLEKEWRTGKLSNNILGEKYGVSEGAIRKKAKGNPSKGISPWKKDLFDEYQHQLKESILEEGLPESTNLVLKKDEQIQEDKDVVESAVRSALEVVRGHRKRIGYLSEITESLAKELISCVKSGTMTSFIMEMKGTHEGVFDMSTKLSRLISEQIKLERQSFNMDVKEETSKEDEEMEEAIKRHMVKNGFKG